MNPYGFLWVIVGLYGSFLVLMGFYGSLWVLICHYGFLGVYMVPYLSLWVLMGAGPSESFWDFMGLYGSLLACLHVHFWEPVLSSSA